MFGLSLDAKGAGDVYKSCERQAASDTARHRILPFGKQRYRVSCGCVGCEMWKQSVDTSLFPGSLPSVAPAKASPVHCNIELAALYGYILFYGAHLKAPRCVGTQLSRINIEYEAYPARGEYSDSPNG